MKKRFAATEINFFELTHTFLFGCYLSQKDRFDSTAASARDAKPQAPFSSNAPE